MRSFRLIAALGFTLASQGHASDWSGFHVGLEMGAALSASKMDFKTVDPFDPMSWVGGQIYVDQLNAFPAETERSSTLNGAMDLGYDWQFGNFVVGMGTGLSALSISQDRRQTGK